MKKFQLIAVSNIISLGFLFFLFGCGGGGSSSTPPANAATGVTAAQVAGTFSYVSYFSYIQSGNRLCNGIHNGSLTLAATSTTGGTFSFVLASPEQYLCLTGTTASASNGTGATESGTFTVAADGSGTITITSGGSGTFPFQFSKDLNTVVLPSSSSSSIGIFMAMRM
ncbi:MAG: hypothetical protein HY036_01625 [Nitrospirae bacterium]|nr:hypothetical protein [Nitrospirota bacterium]